MIEGQETLPLSALQEASARVSSIGIPSHHRPPPPPFPMAYLSFSLMQTRSRSKKMKA